jgi:hypothetical protein
MVCSRTFAFSSVLFDERNGNSQNYTIARANCVNTFQTPSFTYAAFRVQAFSVTYHQNYRLNQDYISILQAISSFVLARSSSALVHIHFSFQFIRWLYFRRNRQR